MFLFYAFLSTLPQIHYFFVIIKGNMTHLQNIKQSWKK